ncbi:hypothetical protein [Oryzicola mucosus]|uniref:Uncharacterized protein n=1 Tax=Oryzicola mucosus TaxID=2767425 RepID=A0A8J6Q4M1_9HYPH|nr:hypothetical protein [Oryzicola mucosus]MBD0416135.1 hypothetical protein [Oryzicola mucosus]
MSTIDRHRFDAFLHAVLEPLPDAVMLDTAHNSELRRATYNKFICMRRRVDYYESLRAAFDCTVAWDWYPEEAQQFEPLLVHFPRRSILEKHYHAALYDCLMTLVGDKVCIEWKKRRVGQIGYPDKKADVEAAIARDEAFCLAHPVRAKGRTPKGGEPS